MKSSNQIKIETFDRYVMQGGSQSLQNIEETCDWGFNVLGLGYEPEVFNDVVIEVIQKLTGDLNS